MTYISGETNKLIFANKILKYKNNKKSKTYDDGASIESYGNKFRFRFEIENNIEALEFLKTHLDYIESITMVFRLYHRYNTIILKYLYNSYGKKFKLLYPGGDFSEDQEFASFDSIDEVIAELHKLFEQNKGKI